MKQQQVEQKLRQAVEHAAPEYSDRLREAAGHLSPAPSGRRRGRATRRLIAAVAAVAACAILAVGVLGLVRHQARQQGAAVVVLDVNPSIQLTINSEERVLSVLAQNSDATHILDGMDLTGVQLNVAVNALIGSLLKNSYISELANSILISVEGKSEQSAALLQQRLTNDINDLLAGFGIDGAILSQTLQQDDDVARLAASYGISRGKAALILKLIGQNPSLQTEELAGLTIHALNLLLAEPQTETLTLTGSASDSGYIGADAAKAAALAHAGIDEASAARLTVQMDYERGRMVYEVDFDANGLEYEYDIDALTGEVVKYSFEPDDDLPAQSIPNVGTPAADIGREAALAAALRHAGLTQSEVTDVYVKADTDDGYAVYDVEFLSGGVEYDYEIDAVTGEVRAFDFEPDDHAAAAQGSAGQGSTADIGSSKAKSIALSHAGVSSSDVSNIKVERDRDDGVLVYEVEFTAGGYEYEYEIDAVTGEVRAFDFEPDDHAAAAQGSAGQGSTADIGSSKAKSIALSHAGVSSSDVSNIKVERDRDDGVLVYEVEFTAGGYEYEYEIDAVTGEVLGHSRETLDRDDD